MKTSSFINKGLLRLIMFFIFHISTTDVFCQTQLDTKRVIFPKTVPIPFNFKKDTSIKRFTPIIQDIDKVDTLINVYFLQTNSVENRNFSYTEYYKQYAGFWINNKKSILIYASCNQPEYFLKHISHPKGGGDCYFQALVNLDDKKISEFYSNAPK